MTGEQHGQHEQLTPNEAGRLRSRLHEAVPVAPTTDGWVEAAARARGRRRRRTVAAAVAAAVVVGGVATASATLLDNEPVLPSATEATVYLLDATGRGPTGLWEDYRLVPVEVSLPGQDSAALEAAQALVRLRPADGTGLANGWYVLTIDPQPIAGVVDVRLDDGLITVELGRDVWDPYPGVDCICPPGEAVMQQLVWTVQTALGSDAPVQLVLDGAPAPGVFLYATDRPIGADPGLVSPPAPGLPAPAGR